MVIFDSYVNVYQRVSQHVKQPVPVAPIHMATWVCLQIWYQEM